MTLSSSVAESRVRYWQAHVRAPATSGLSCRANRRRHQLSYHALAYWVHKFRQAPVTAVPPDLPRLEILHDLPEDEKVCA